MGFDSLYLLRTERGLQPLVLQLPWCDDKYISLDLIISHHHKI
jgi:hypothetical protein